MRRAISVTTTPGARLSATIARFCSALQRRRRSGPVMISTLDIAPSLTPVLTPSLALVLTSPNQSRSARRSSPDGYALGWVGRIDRRAGVAPDPRRRPTGAARNARTSAAQEAAPGRRDQT